MASISFIIASDLSVTLSGIYSFLLSFSSYCAMMENCFLYCSCGQALFIVQSVLLCISFSNVQLSNLFN